MARPACSASAIAGRTPMPTTTRSAWRFSPLFKVTLRSSIEAAVVPRWNVTPCCSWSLRMNFPTSASQDLLHRDGLRCDHVHVDIARAQRCRHLETDEARADHHGSLRGQRLGDQRAAVGERAQIVHVRKIAAGHRRAAPARRRSRAAAHRRRWRLPSASCTCRLLVSMRGDARVQLQVDVVLLVELRRSQRIPLRGRAAREIALRKIRAIARHRFVGAQHREATGVALAAKRLGSGVARGAAADDHDRFRHAGRRRKRLRLRARELFPDITLPSRCSTRQQETGFSAGARSASPVRRLKQA